MRVNVYQNLKMKNSPLSIRCAVSGLVLGHAYHAELHDCRFVVQSSRQSRDSKRNVHAWVIGNLEYVTDFLPFKSRELDGDVIHITASDLQLIRWVTEDSPTVFKGVSCDVSRSEGYTLKGTEIGVKKSEAASIYCDGAIYAREPKQ